MSKDAKEFLKKCIEFYSPSGQEEDFSKFIGDYLRNHDFKVHFDKVGNLIAEKGINKPVLLLVSHMDTIPGELPIIEKDGKIIEGEIKNFGETYIDVMTPDGTFLSIERNRISSIKIKGKEEIEVQIKEKRGEIKEIDDYSMGYSSGKRYAEREKSGWAEGGCIGAFLLGGCIGGGAT